MSSCRAIMAMQLEASLDPKREEEAIKIGHLIHYYERKSPVRIVWVKVKHVFWKLLETLRNLVYLPSWSSWRRFRLYFARKSPLWRR